MGMGIGMCVDHCNVAVSALCYLVSKSYPAYIIIDNILATIYIRQDIAGDEMVKLHIVHTLDQLVMNSCRVYVPTTPVSNYVTKLFLPRR
jgi:hypothetical protein